MSELQEYLRYIVTLTAVLDPFLAIPIFISVTAARDEAARRRLANAITITVFLVLAVSAIFIVVFSIFPGTIVEAADVAAKSLF